VHGTCAVGPYMYIFHGCGAKHLCVCVHGVFFTVVFLLKVLCRCVFVLARVSKSVHLLFLYHENMCINELREVVTV